MEFGCHLPVYGPAATREVLIPFARRMEALGYDSLWASDHIVIPYAIASRYPYSATGDFPLPPATNFLEPLTALALVAGATERIRLGTTVLVLPHRHPVLTAKILATLDHLAPGRVILGAGVGWMREEIEMFGVPYARRGAWSDEAIRVMRACWAGERVEHRGEFWRFPPFASLPRPARGKVPIWIGGHTERALRRVAELGDGWHAAFPSAEKMKAGMQALEAACRRAGREPKSLTISARVGLPAKQEADALLREIRGLAELGVSHVILESRARDLADLTQIYERFAKDVRGKL
jgi:probable F420-dependent oxidoreductase